MILITGGTGSFGQAFAEKLLRQETSYKIIIYSRDEHKQEQMAKRLKHLDKNERLRFFIGDIRDKDRLRLAVREACYIIHAAALKIVPTAEYNPFEYVKTNILGSQNLIDVLTENMPYQKTVIALSTDKAVAPKNLYGSTKLCMEKMFLAANNIMGEYGHKFHVVRYGNVANSNGSVIRVFKEQKDKCLPLTVTHHEMTRYWITLEDAVKFVQNKMCRYGVNGGQIYIPDMPSFKIMDLARAFDHTIDVNTGVRPGEKIHEQIDDNRFSNTNDKWLNVEDLREKLKELNVL
jgi:UDP-N-acetylglucosamine 4,6-dehydratase